jgi:polyferredoxin
MVTIASFLVFILLTILVLVIDISTYHYSFMKAWGILFQTEMIGRKVLYATCVISFISAIIIDIKIGKKKSKKQSL